MESFSHDFNMVLHVYIMFTSSNQLKYTGTEDVCNLNGESM